MMILTLNILAIYPCDLCSSPDIPSLADALATGHMSGVLRLQSNNEPPDTPRTYFWDGYAELLGYPLATSTSTELEAWDLEFRLWDHWMGIMGSSAGNDGRTFGKNGCRNIYPIGGLDWNCSDSGLTLTLMNTQLCTPHLACSCGSSKNRKWGANQMKRNVHAVSLSWRPSSSMLHVILCIFHLSTFYPARSWKEDKVTTTICTSTHDPHATPPPNLDWNHRTQSTRNTTEIACENKASPTSSTNTTIASEIQQEPWSYPTCHRFRKSGVRKVAEFAPFYPRFWRSQRSMCPWVW